MSRLEIGGKEAGRTRNIGEEGGNGKRVLLSMGHQFSLKYWEDTKCGISYDFSLLEAPFCNR